MGTHVYDTDFKLTWPEDAPIAGHLTITNGETGEVLFEGESRVIKDGDTFTATWTRSSS